MTNIIKHQFQGQAVSFNTDGWINATEISSRFGKEPTQWLRQIDALEYISALSVRFGNSGFLTELSKIKGLDTSAAVSRNKVLSLVKRSGLVKVKGGSPSTGGGTWLHPKLAVPYARWLSVEFAVWCDLQIDELIRSSLAPAGMTEYMLQMLRHEPAGWERRFPPEYYHALARVTNTAYCGHQGGTPAIYGSITMQWVYQAVMPAEVLAEIKVRRQGGEKLHQWLSDGGAAVLDRQIGAVTMLANTSCDYQDFTARCSQVFGVKGQIRMVFPSAA